MALENNAHLLRDDEGKIVGVEGVVRDITERIKTESQNAEMGRIVESSANEIFVFDAATHRFLIVNQSARLNLGYTLPEILNMTIADIRSTNSELDTEGILESLRSGKETVAYHDRQMLRKDGTEYTAEVSLQYSRTQLRPVFFAILYDVTARRKAEEELSRSRRIHSLGLLTGGVAHDFNNMLQALQMNLEKLKPDSQDKLNWYANAERGIERSARLTHRLLAFARQQTLLPKVVDVNAVLRDLAPLFTLTATEAVLVELDLQAIELRAEIDQGQVENAILNLVINARDAMLDGGKMCLSTRLAQLSESQALSMDELSAGDYIEICLIDNGAGMSETVLQKSIEPFYTTKSAIEGTGLGLSTVYGFAKQSGGYMSIASKTGEGTTIKLYFPLSSKPLSTNPIKPRYSPTTTPQNELILLIEDDPVIRQLACGSLEDLGYQALPASNSQEAMQLATQYQARIKLVISDVLLADGETGPEVVAQIEGLQSGIATIFMSGHTREYWGDKHSFPANALFLHKPFKMDELKRSIEQLLSLSAAELSLLDRIAPH